MSLAQWIKERLSGEPVGRRFESLADVERSIGMNSIYSQIRPLIDAHDIPEENIWFYLQDVYFDAGIMYAIIQQGGKLFRADVRVADDNTVTLGEFIPVTPLFVPSVSRTDGERFQNTKIIRTADGRYRWLSISNTAILNRVGELDSRALFDSFVEHAQRTGEYPYRTFNHEGEVMRTGQADFIARDGYTYITSGLYDVDSPLAAIERKAIENNPEQWGESIGFSVTAEPEIIRTSEDGINIPVYNEGVNVEISTCLERSAAAWFTAPLLIGRTATEVKKRMQQSTLRAIGQLIGDAGVLGAEADALMAHFQTSVDAVNERAVDGDTISRTTEEEGDGSGLGDAVDAIIASAGSDSSVARAGAEEVKTAVSDPAPAAGEGLVIDDSVIDAVVARMLESDQLAAVLRTGEGNVLERIASDVDALTKRFDDLEEVANVNFATVSNDLAATQAAVAAEVQRAADMPAAPQNTVVYRPSVNSGTTSQGVARAQNEPSPGISNIPHYAGTQQ